MSFLRRLFQSFSSQRPASKYASYPPEQLLSTGKQLIREAIQSYKPLKPAEHPNLSQAEYACFIFFWIQHWHDQQPQVVKTFDTPLTLLMHNAQDAASGFRYYHMRHHDSGWSPNDVFTDRVRLYSSIVEHEPQVSSDLPPSLFVACHLLATYAQRTRTLSVLPTARSTNDILSLCLGASIIPDAFEQFNLYEHSKTALSTIVPQITELLAEIHQRRLANDRNG